MERLLTHVCAHSVIKGGTLYTGIFIYIILNVITSMVEKHLEEYRLTMAVASIIVATAVGQWENNRSMRK